MTFDGKAFGSEIVGVVKSYLAKELAPLARRLDALEKRIEAIPAPIDLSAHLAALKAAVDAIEIPELPKLPELPELPDIACMVDDAVKTAVSKLPVPKDGQSVTLDDVQPLIASEVEKRVRQLPQAKDGKDGADGVGMTGALIDRNGNLVVTMTNGETKDLGPVVGKDGEPGAPGFNLEDFDATVMDDGRTVLLSFTGREIDYKVELGFPVMLYRGVFREGEYAKGDTVTWGGSLWHCDAEKTTEKPGDGSSAWTLCAKKGRDGKDGVVKGEKSMSPVRVGVPVGAQ